MAVAIVVPGLRFARGFDPMEGLDLPGLTGWLGKANKFGRDGMRSEPWLMQAFGAENCGIAALTASVDLPDAGADAIGWRIDPIQARIDRDRALVLDASSLGITRDESIQLIDALNRQFAPDGLNFFAPHPERWYLRMDKAMALQTTPLSQAIGQDMQSNLPRGADAKRWHALLNEMQMLLYGHPVNDARSLSGAPLINSVWLWGEGGAAGNIAATYSSVIGDDILLAALAHHTRIPLHNTIAAQAIGIVDGTLLWLDSLLPAARAGDLHAWRDALQNLDKAWLQPLFARWRNGEFPDLHLILPDPAGTLELVLNPRARWRFWRRAGSTSLLAV